MLERMLSETPMLLLESRRRKWSPRRMQPGADVRAEDPRKKTSRLRAASARKRGAHAAEPEAQTALPDGWQRRVREQSHNLARAIEMLEQAIAMMSEPKAHSLARAECLRGAGLLTLVAAAELLVVAGWFEADQAVRGGAL